MKSWQIWSEGYAVTGNSSGAVPYGSVLANTFKEACDIKFQSPEHKIYYNPKNLTYWGCKLFSNESDARKRFG